MIEEENENLEEDGAEEPKTKKPSSMKVKQFSNIQNNRFMNQKIYLLFINRQYNPCLQLIEKCKPDQFKLYVKSQIYRSQFKLQKSLLLLSQCQVKNRMNFNYLKNISKNYYLLGKYKSSLQAANEAHKLNISDYQIFYLMAKISVAMKDIDAAIGHLKKSLSKEPNEESSIFLAKLMLEKGKPVEAAEQLKRALVISSQNDQIYQMLGEICLKDGLIEQALQYFNSSLQVNPYKYQSLFSLGSVKIGLNSIEEALDKYIQAFKFSQNSALFWNNLASIMVKKNKQLIAYCCLKKALFLDPFKAEIHTNLGKILMKKERYLGARIHFQTSLKLKKDPQVYNLLAVCLSELGDNRNAQNCYKQILKQNKSIKFRINYLCLLLRMGEKKKCGAILKEIESLGNISKSAWTQKIDEIKRMI